MQWIAPRWLKRRSERENEEGGRERERAMKSKENVAILLSKHCTENVAIPQNKYCTENVTIPPKMTPFYFMYIFIEIKITHTFTYIYYFF